MCEIKTPNGDIIAVTDLEPNFPAIKIVVDGEIVARVEYNSTTKRRRIVVYDPLTEMEEPSAIVNFDYPTIPCPICGGNGAFLCCDECRGEAKRRRDLKRSEEDA